MVRAMLTGLSDAELSVLYPQTDWDIVDSNAAIPKAYNNFSTLSLVKVHVLPYLLPLVSE